MLRSRANTLLSVRRVTERNARRLTAGVNGEVVLTPKAKTELVDRVAHSREPFKALPVRRVFIPKPGSNKQRPLGITPGLFRHARQARTTARPGRSWGTQNPRISDWHRRYRARRPALLNNLSPCPRPTVSGHARTRHLTNAAPYQLTAPCGPGIRGSSPMAGAPWSWGRAAGCGGQAWTCCRGRQRPCGSHCGWRSALRHVLHGTLMRIPRVCPRSEGQVCDREGRDVTNSERSSA
jgi:hypothetical protein